MTYTSTRQQPDKGNLPLVGNFWNSTDEDGNIEPKNNPLSSDKTKEKNQKDYEIEKSKKKQEKKIDSMNEEEKSNILRKSRDTIIRETIEDFFTSSLVEELQEIQTTDASTVEAQKYQNKIEKLRDEILFQIQKNILTANDLRRRESIDQLKKFDSFDFPEAKIILKQFNDFRVITLHKEATHQNSPLCRWNEKKQIFEEASQYVETLSQWITGKVKSKNGDHPIYTMIKNETLTLTKQFSDPDFAPCQNGLFNTKTKELIPYSKDFIILNPFETSYNPSATNPKIMMEDGLFDVEEDFFKPLATTESGFFDSEIYEEMWDSISLACQPWRRYDRAFMLYDEKGATGKGTFKKMIQSVVGDSLSKTISMKEFEKDDKLLTLVGARLATCDENAVNEYLKEVPKFKSCVTGDPVTVSVKYKDATTFSFDGKIFQCMNSLPSSSDKGPTLSRRFLFIPFMNCFLNKENKKIKGEYITDQRVREYILNKALNRATKDIPFEKWPRRTKEILNMYELENDSLLAWWDDFETEFFEETNRKDKEGRLDTWDAYPFHMLHDIYNEWCRKGGTGSGREVSLKYQIFKKEFINKILPKIANEWTLPNNEKNVFSTTVTMKARPNRLLLAYKCGSIYNGNIDELERANLSVGEWNRGLRSGALKSSYQGIIRIN